MSHILDAPGFNLSGDMDSPDVGILTITLSVINILSSTALVWVSVNKTFIASPVSLNHEAFVIMGNTFVNVCICKGQYS